MPVGWVIGLLVLAWVLGAFLVVALCASAREIDEGLGERPEWALEPLEADPPGSARFEGGVSRATTLD